MKNMMKRYRFFFFSLAVSAGIWILWPSVGLKALQTIGFSLQEMLLVIPPVFILLGLLDVWVPREMMIRHMGPDSGLKGGILAFVLGSAAAGPLYAAFPVAAVLMRKGASLMNVLIFIGAWSTTKIPMFLFEYSALGPEFAVTRLLVDIPGIVGIAWILSRFIPKTEVEAIYAGVAETMDSRKGPGKTNPPSPEF